MIEFNYLLEVDMGTEKRSYTPSEEVSRGLKNIFRLQGPNSSGKSTLMNIIALASHGLSKGKIAPSVKSRMEELVVPGYKDLEFEIFIQDPVTKRTLRSTKEKGYREITVEESLDGVKDFSIIAADQFEKKYNLIYDIPENPVGRLNELTNEIMTVQDLFNRKTKDFQYYVEGINNNITDSISPEMIKEMKNNLKFDEGNLQKYHLTAEKKRVEALKKLSIASRLYDLDVKAKEAESIYKKIDKDDSKTGDGKVKATYLKKMKQFSLLVQDFTKLKLQIGIEANKCRYAKIDDFKDAMTNISDDATILMKSGGVTQSSIEEIEDLKEFATSMRSTTKGEELRVMAEIIRVLEQFVDKNIDLPDLGSLDKFLKNYTTTYEKMNENYDIKTLDAVIKLTSSALESIKDINDLANTIQPPEEDTMALFERKQNLDLLDNQREIACKARSNYVRDVSSPSGIDMYNLDETIKDLNKIFNNEHLNKSYNEIKNIYDASDVEYNKLIGEKNAIEKRIRDLKNRIDDAESKATSPYIEYTDEIKDLLNHVSGLLSLFIEAKKKLNVIERKDYGIYKKNDSFFKSVWLYLGKRLKNIRHLDKEYLASEVNLIDGIITTDDKTEIHLSDMGTGQSQLSYLKGLLSADDDRMIIALFDEVSTMTDSTLEVLFEEFEKLQKKGRLMIGMTVSPADNIEVRSYGI